MAAYVIVATLAACSGGVPSVNPTQENLTRTGVSPKVFDRIHSLQAVHRSTRPLAKGPRNLFVDDQEGAVEVLVNGTWKNTSSISNGIDDPNGNFVDKRGSLYVANYGADGISQYAPGASMPDFTYNAGMIDPDNVTVDGHGNVYESDYDDALGSGFVNEYKQGVNDVFASCSPGGNAEGVAVDGRGNVFVSLNFASGGAGVVEYKGGLEHCNAITLTASLKFAGGIALDKSGNLLVCDQNAGVVDVLDPPYASISSTFGYGLAAPFHVTLNKKNTQIYVTDPGTGAVDVFTYPHGELTAKLGVSEGLSEPYGAVDGENYVP